MDGIKSYKTLKTNKEFSRVYKQGFGFHSPYFVIFFIKSATKKVGFVASKKVGNAVCRNRCKRVLREIFRYHYDSLKCGMYVFVAKKSLLELDFKKANLEFNKTLIRINSK